MTSTTPTTPATPTHEWLFARVHPRHPSSDPARTLDALVERVVRPVADAVAGLGSSGEPRWFWLRYVDHAGPHLRLRVRARHSDLERVLPVVDAASTGEDLTLSVYEPEPEVFGGAVGVDRAELVFQDSSALGLAAVEQVPWGRPRVHLAAGLLARAVDVLPADARAAHLRGTAVYWRGGAPRTTPAGIDPHAADAWLDGALAEHVDRWLAGLRTPLDWPQAPRLGRWVFRHAHLMLNRLGVPPSGEAALADALAAARTLPGDEGRYVFPDR